MGAFLDTECLVRVYLIDTIKTTLKQYHIHVFLNKKRIKIKIYFIDTMIEKIYNECINLEDG